MASIDEQFFEVNIINVNKTVEKILFSAIVTPFVIYALTLVDVWHIELQHCLIMFGYELTVAFISHFLNKSKSKKVQIVSMYFGVIAASIFVAILGYTGKIRLSISYAFGTVLTFLYYDKPLTIISCVFGYILSLGLSYIRTSVHPEVTLEKYTQVQVYIQYAIGFTIEFFFLMLCTLYISGRAKKTISELRNTSLQRNEAIENLQKSLNQIESKNEELEQTQYEIIQFVAKVLGSHDLFTGRHVMHTHRYVELICEQLIKQGDYIEELNEETVELFKTTAFLHDIGKVHIPEGILNKIGKFTDIEFDMMKSHTTEGKTLLDYLPKIDDGTFNKVAKNMAYCHHERWDGTGYPRKLKENEIPLCARIMAAADVLDALISQRLYKEPMTVQQAIEVFKNSRGTHFEPCIADAVIACEPIIQIVDQEFKDSESTTNVKELEWWQRYYTDLKIQ